MDDGQEGPGGARTSSESAPPLDMEDDERRRRRVRRMTIVGIVAAALAAVALFAVVHGEAPRLMAAQRARSRSFAEFRDLEGLSTGAWWDCAFAVAYGVLGVLVFSLFRRRQISNDDAWHPAATAGALLVAVAAAADLVENGILLRALGIDDDEPVSSALLGGMRAAGVVKWSLLWAAAIALVMALVARGRKVVDEKVPEPPDRWKPPEIDNDGKGPHRLGVCLSGGGIRSAAFSLGALQALQDKHILQNAEYLAAASGGGYLAAGWAVADANASAVSPGQAWSRGSTEERWFRDHSSYLVPSLLGGAKGVGRLLGGLLVNFLIVWLLLFLVARPVGWAIAAAHDELAPVAPVVIARDTTGELQIASVEPIGTADAVVDGATVRATRYAVRLAPAPGPRANPVCFDTKPFNPADRDHCFPVEQVSDRPAIVEVRAGKAHVLVQPKARVVDPERCDRQLTCDVHGAVRIAKHPTVALKDSAVHEPVGTDELALGTQPEVRSTSGLVGRPDPRYRSWMWESSIGLLLGGGLVGLLVMGLRPGERRMRIGRDLARALAIAGLAALVVTMLLPALAMWLPELAADLPGTNLSIGDPLLPSGGLVLASLAAARQYLSSNKKGSGTGPADSKGGVLPRLWKRVTGAKEQLSWYETSPTKIILFVVLVLGFVVSFVSQLQYSIANGYNGRLLGISFVRDHLPDSAFLPEWARFGIVAGVLVVFACLVDAHAWSLYPFYKRRLTLAYMLRRVNGRAQPIPYDEMLPFTPSGGRWNGLPPDPCGPKRPGPKLVLCCAVNLSEFGVVPPGRRAASFTFDADFIGGPLVGYAPAGDYWAHLPESRRRDVTIPSAMAISGAAFSPAMGKKNLGPVGSVLALANLRLGVWLPHPRLVKAQNRRKWGWLRRPGWTWFMREVLNSYGFQRRYLYVSDGGHWDNLGLVELLRRGCTQIICISAAGDGALSFGTLAEAIALAREELGVDIVLDPTPLRPPVAAPKTPPARELRRSDDKAKSAAFAPGAFQVGRYTWRSSTAWGTILYIETALTADLPFDVHGFAESETIFPDDSTGDQVFNHRQFESFRALGYHQVSRALS